MTSTATDRIYGARSSLAIKAPCAAATTANITLSGEQTIDAHACVTGERVLVKNQTSGVDNGIYVCDTGAWSRAPDFDGTSDVVTGTMTYVVNGTTNGNKFYQVTTTGTIIPGTTSLTFDTVSIAFGSPGANSITYAMIQQVAANAILCNPTAASANVTDTIALAVNQLMGRGASGNLAAIGIGTGLTMTGTTLSASAASGIVAGALSFVGMWNGTIVASRNASAETVAIKTYAGADPSAGDPVTFIFRNVTAGTGDYVFIQATAALNLTISSGSTMGATNAIPFRLWLAVFNDASTLRLGLVNCLSGMSIMNINDDVVRSSTAEGGAGAADSAQVIYTGTAVASKAMRILGYLEYTLAAVGTWGTAPTKIQLFGPGVALPGTELQYVESLVTGTGTGAVAIPVDNSIPQNTEGTQITTVSITPTAGATLLEYGANFLLGEETNVATYISGAVFQDSTANAIAAEFTVSTAIGSGLSAFFTNIKGRILSGAAAATTFKFRGGLDTATAMRWNGFNGAQVFNGVIQSKLWVRELQT